MSQQQIIGYRVQATYGVNRIRIALGMNLAEEVKKQYEEKTREKGARLHSFKILREWEDWTNRYVEIEAEIHGANPIKAAIILAIVGLVSKALTVLAIFLVGREIIQPIVRPIAELPTPIGGLAIVALIGLGLFILLTWVRKR